MLTIKSANGFRWLSLLLSFFVASSQTVPALAQTANLDLASQQRTESTPSSMTEAAIIRNGNSVMQVLPGTALTPAQSQALSQVLTTGKQSLNLGSAGQAVGGSLLISSGPAAGVVNIPQNVRVISDFSNGAPLNVIGNLVNAGTLYAVSTNAEVTNAILSANNISNTASGLISSVLPAGGLAKFENAIADLSLSLIATNDIVNHGTISGAGALHLAAGGQVQNSGVLSALESVNIATPSFSNHSIVTANGDINIVQQVSRNADLAALASQLAGHQAWATLTTAQNLAVDGQGVLESISGSINFDHGDAIKGNVLSISNIHARAGEVNLIGGSGLVTAAFGSVNGILNVSGGAGNAGVLSGDLHLGTVNFSGDPTFWAEGDINSLGAVSVTEPLTFLAEGDINLFNFNYSTGGNRFTAIAGTELTPSSGAANPLNLGETVTANGPSATGGSVTCNGCNINTTSAAAVMYLSQPTAQPAVAAFFSIHRRASPVLAPEHNRRAT
jgi:hypothetical protein